MLTNISSEICWIYKITVSASRQQLNAVSEGYWFLHRFVISRIVSKSVLPNLIQLLF